MYSNFQEGRSLDGFAPSFLNNQMRYLLFLLLLFTSCSRPSVEKLSKDLQSFEVDNARWNEKARWFKYINDSIQDEAFPIRLKVAVGIMTPKDGFDSLLNLIDKAHTPFYK